MKVPMQATLRLWGRALTGCRRCARPGWSPRTITTHTLTTPPMCSVGFPPPPALPLGSHHGRCFHASVRALAFEVPEDDLEEEFIKGWGKGGQKINKVRNCVQLRHIPTGMMVQCQDGRSLTANRAIARKTLALKVEFHYKGADSKIGRKIARRKKQKDRNRRRALKKAREKEEAEAEAGAAPEGETETGGGA